MSKASKWFKHLGHKIKKTADKVGTVVGLGGAGGDAGVDQANPVVKETDDAKRAIENKDPDSTGPSDDGGWTDG